MSRHREILQLARLKLNPPNIAGNYNISKNTANCVLKHTNDL